MYCRRMDMNAGFLVSYSYCLETDNCLMDAWNYINRPCNNGWIAGSKGTLSDCYPNQSTCPPTFISGPDKFGQYSNQTWTLGQGSSCKVVVDATKGLGRVIFDESAYLGIEPGKWQYKTKEVITFDSGSQN